MNELLRALTDEQLAVFRGQALKTIERHREELPFPGRDEFDRDWLELIVKEIEYRRTLDLEGK